MKYKLTAMVLAVKLLALGSTHVQAGDRGFNTLQAIDEYKVPSIRMIEDGGEFFCPDADTQGSLRKYASCDEYSALIKRGCYGKSREEFGRELVYGAACAELTLLDQVKVAKENHFDMDSANWWHHIPASIIPLPGGIESDEMKQQAQGELETLVKGKTLGELSLVNNKSNPRLFETVLGSHTRECGVVKDTFKLFVQLIADFNGDGKADLLLSGTRDNLSDDCPLNAYKEGGGSTTFLYEKHSAQSELKVTPYQELIESASN
ncbi:hypothetical protein [Pseudoalteromonas sp. T1lg10]|uniref:hypothetical protein n=1 Tax=Pseudoalteromonas sp. T1lg10 TaxID=2077093 RepID=UPI000CF6FE2B|nr:hypothetical protein [Pseudoalteromonas sp. T1lg10]